MPNIRLLLWGAFAAILFLNYETWVHDYAPPTTPVVATNSQTGAPTLAAQLGDSVPEAASAASAAAVASPSTAPSTTTALTTPAAADATETSAASGAIHVVTDVLDVTINTKGGELDHADLLQYPLHKDTPHVPVTLMTLQPPASKYVLQSGLAGPAGAPAPPQHATWNSRACR
jgi:YidC/Oxa1 family membrane protein insertase